MGTKITQQFNRHQRKVYFYSNMIKYRLTKEEIFSKITEYEVYRHYLGDFSTVQNIHSPFHTDSSPSFRVSYRDGKLTHFDFSVPGMYGDCISLVMQIEKVSFTGALRIIDKIFNLGLASPKQKGYEPPQYQIPIFREKRQAQIQIIKQALQQQVIDYHLDYGITQLNDTFSPKKIYLNDQEQELTQDPSGLVMAYEYNIDNKKYYKIYRPNAHKKGKWMSNVPFSAIDGEIPHCQDLIITKSRKDYKVLKYQVFTNTIAVQAENPAALKEETLAAIQQRVKGNVYIWFDNDQPGKESSRHLTELLGWKHINNPDNLLPLNCKDPASWRKDYGIGPLVNHLREKGLKTIYD